jgi:hypothetical protein
MEVSDHPTCELTYATLRIDPKSLDPSGVTDRLGIEPSMRHWHGSRRRIARPRKWWKCVISVA